MEYTEEVLIPRMADLMDDKLEKGFQSFERRFEKKMDEKFKNGFESFEKKMDLKFARQNYEIKEYVDKKLSNYTDKIFKKLDKKYEQEKQFRSKVVELFKKNKIGTAEDWAYLDGMVAGT